MALLRNALHLPVKNEFVNLLPTFCVSLQISLTQRARVYLEKGDARSFVKFLKRLESANKLEILRLQELIFPIRTHTSLSKQENILLGMSYQLGIGVIRDELMAEHYFEKAMELGDHVGTFALNRIPYLSFINQLAAGSLHQLKQKSALYKNAIKGGPLVFDQSLLDSLVVAAQEGYLHELVLIAFIFSKNEKNNLTLCKLARDYLTFASERDDPFALFLLADMFEHGVGCVKNVIEASRLYRRAIEISIEKQFAFLPYQPKLIAKTAWLKLNNLVTHVLGENPKLSAQLDVTSLTSKQIQCLYHFCLGDFSITQIMPERSQLRPAETILQECFLQHAHLDLIIRSDDLALLETMLPPAMFEDLPKQEFFNYSQLPTLFNSIVKPKKSEEVVHITDKEILMGMYL